MRSLGVIDLGSNTSRLAVFGFQPEKWFRLIDEIREPVRLGQSLWTEGRLTPQAMDRGEAALRLYAHYCRSMGLAEVDVIATSAIRDAANGEEFLRRIEPFGFPIRILSGKDEAHLGVLAVCNGFDLSDAWVMDLGGGSAQISEMRERRMLSGRSYPLGAVRLSEAFLHSDPPRSEQIEALERYVGDQLASIIPRMRRHPAPLVAMGGSIRNLARAIQRRRAYPFDRLHGYFLGLDDLEALTQLLASLKAEQRARIRSINADRADIIVAAALVFRRILRSSGAKGLWISGQGVREGAFFRRFLPAPHVLPDTREFYRSNFFLQYGDSPRHVRQVRFLARRLFEESALMHSLDAEDAYLLDTAALLHDVGMTVGYRDHHKHGAYLLAGTALGGFSHREQALLIQIVRYHRKGQPTLAGFQRLPEIREGDSRRLLQLTACLRLAEYLERSRNDQVKDVKIEIEPARVRLRLVAEETPFVEIWETRKQSGLFKRAFGRDLILDEKDVLRPHEVEP